MIREVEALGRKKANLEEVEPSIYGHFLEELEKEGYAKDNPEKRKHRAYMSARAYILKSCLECTWADAVRSGHFEEARGFKKLISYVEKMEKRSLEKPVYKEGEKGDDYAGIPYLRHVYHNNFIDGTWIQAYLIADSIGPPKLRPLVPKKDG